MSVCVCVCRDVFEFGVGCCFAFRPRLFVSSLFAMPFELRTAQRQRQRQRAAQQQQKI